MNEINEVWVTAPYRVDFLLFVPRCPRKTWSRKRRLKWIRRETKRIMRGFRPPPVNDFDIFNKLIAAMSPIVQPKWVNEEGWVCPACAGDGTGPHINCILR